jgi:aconitate hydratase
MSVHDAAMRYAQEGTPLVVIAGREYGAGSSRDWAAKGSSLLGVRAVIAESFERIHRANLTAMGVLPLQFPPGVTRSTLVLDGAERIDLLDLDATVAPRATILARIHRADGSRHDVDLTCRIDTASEAQVWRAGGMMPYVLRRLAASPQGVPA